MRISTLRNGRSGKLVPETNDCEFIISRTAGGAKQLAIVIQDGDRRVSVVLSDVETSQLVVAHNNA